MYSLVSMHFSSRPENKLDRGSYRMYGLTRTGKKVSPKRKAYNSSLGASKLSTLTHFTVYSYKIKCLEAIVFPLLHQKVHRCAQYSFIK